MEHYKDCPGMSAPLIKERVHISSIREGDMVEVNGHLKTVGRGNLKYDKFMGLSLFGDTYRLGTILVTKCAYERAVPVTVASEAN
jgi:hypothetical protein